MRDRLRAAPLFADLDDDHLDRLAAATTEFLAPAGMIRPIAYVRADWFVSVITQPPFYEDFLRLPFEVKELEVKKLGL